MRSQLFQACVILMVTLGALWFFTAPPPPELENCRVSHVYDGDTVALDCGAGEIRARLMGFNTPETRDAECPQERALGDQATARLRALLAGGGVTIRQGDGADKYGRQLIRIWIGHEDVAAIMIREKLAEPYSGGHRRDWCNI